MDVSGRIRRLCGSTVVVHSQRSGSSSAWTGPATARRGRPSRGPGRRRGGSTESSSFGVFHPFEVSVRRDDAAALRGGRSEAGLLGDRLRAGVDQPGADLRVLRPRRYQTPLGGPELPLGACSRLPAGRAFRARREPVGWGRRCTTAALRGPPTRPHRTASAVPCRSWSRHNRPHTRASPVVEVPRERYPHHGHLRGRARCRPGKARMRAVASRTACRRAALPWAPPERRFVHSIDCGQQGRIVDERNGDEIPGMR